MPFSHHGVWIRFASDSPTSVTRSSQLRHSVNVLVMFSSGYPMAYPSSGRRTNGVAAWTRRRCGVPVNTRPNPRYLRDSYWRQGIRRIARASSDTSHRTRMSGATPSTAQSGWLSSYTGLPLDTDE